MAPSVAGVVLAAGAGSRLRPLTLERPKPLCPVANRPLVDLAIDKVRAAVGDVGVNVCHGRELMLDHLDRTSVHCAVEPVARGTAGALAGLRRWLDGRGALVVNGDTWCPVDLTSFIDDWNGATVRVLILGTEPFGPRSRIVASLTPWSEIIRLPREPSGLWEQIWRDRLAAETIEVVGHAGPFVDCATPTDYLNANSLALAASSEADDTGSVVGPSASIRASARVSDSAIGDNAVVAGHVSESIVWPGAVVRPHERLHRAIRTVSGLTVLAR